MWRLAISIRSAMFHNGATGGKFLRTVFIGLGRDLLALLVFGDDFRFDNVVVFGALGGRLDHTLANMGVFSKYSELGLKVTVIDDDTAVFFLTGPDIFEAPALESGVVSVFAMSDVTEGVFERGMKWDLDDVVLTNRESIGLSNELIGEAVMIGVEKGTICVIFPVS